MISNHWLEYESALSIDFGTITSSNIADHATTSTFNRFYYRHFG
jgi:hypothetical protein